MLFGPKMQSSSTPNKVDSDEIQGLETVDCYGGVSCKPVIISNECATISYEITPHPLFSLSFTHTFFFQLRRIHTIFWFLMASSYWSASHQQCCAPALSYWLSGYSRSADHSLLTRSVSYSVGLSIRFFLLLAFLTTDFSCLLC